MFRRQERHLFDKAQADALKTAFAGPKSVARRRRFIRDFRYDAGIADIGGIPGLLGGPVIPVADRRRFRRTSMSIGKPRACMPIKPRCWATALGPI